MPQAPSIESADPHPTEDACDISLVIFLSYDGTVYSGFARQDDEGIRTVQSELEHALSVFFRHPVDTVCAGRTDAGVHARGQVVSTPIASSELNGHETTQIITSLNALTPDDISVTGLRFAGAGFSARFDAVEREYRYRIVCGPTPPVFLQRYAWWHKAPLDVEAMRAGAAHLIGEHDFASFCKAESAVDRTTMRRIDTLEIFEEEQMGERHLVVRVEGNAFLHSMVRTIVGTLTCVGTGRQESGWVAEVLEACDRTRAGQTAPACGLTLWSVTYPDGVFHLEP
ncbi:MAG: tRNA pseudouridine(38-40) synthase TruA [Coriobacteriaceae bacterium]|nr:tRNA pseudouridine(38-40) synthase TruA [Coriobacteriaceae bacterium]